MAAKTPVPMEPLRQELLRKFEFLNRIVTCPGEPYRWQWAKPAILECIEVARTLKDQQLITSFSDLLLECCAAMISKEIHEEITFHKNEIPNPATMGWLLSEDSLKIFHNGLSSHRLITVKYEAFKPHFLGNVNPQNHIPFLGNINSLCYLMGQLLEQGVLSACPTPHLQLARHFLNRYSLPLSPKSIRSLKNKGVADMAQIEVLEEIIQKVLATE